MTPIEIEEVINAYIIDNNTNQVSPAKMRFVLKTINSAIQQTSPSAVYAITPLFFDPFTNQFTIQQVANDKNGYLSFEDYNSFKSNLIPSPFNIFKFIQKGFGNTNLTINETGDIFCGWSNDGTRRISEAKWLGGVLTDSENFIPLVQTEI